MENLAKRLARKTASEKNLSLEQECVVAYGLIAIMQMLTIFCIIIVFGLLLGTTYECIILFLGVGFLRKSTGGAHSNSLYSCILFSCLNIILLSCLSSFLATTMSLTFYPILWAVLFILCLFIVKKNAPVDNPKKPIVSDLKKIRLKKHSINKVVLTFVLTLLILILFCHHSRMRSIAISMMLFSLWQCFTLTRLGFLLIAWLDEHYSQMINIS